jgi:transposase-like protein
VRELTTTAAEVVQFRQGIQTKLRARVQATIEVVLDEELEAALGCRSHERTEARRGYRNGSENRRVTTVSVFAR